MYQIRITTSTTTAPNTRSWVIVEIVPITGVPFDLRNLNPNIQPLWEEYNPRTRSHTQVSMQLTRHPDYERRTAQLIHYTPQGPVPSPRPMAYMYGLRLLRPSTLKTLFRVLSTKIPEVVAKASSPHISEGTSRNSHGPQVASSSVAHSELTIRDALAPTMVSSTRCVLFSVVPMSTPIPGSTPSQAVPPTVNGSTPIQDPSTCQTTPPFAEGSLPMSPRRARCGRSRLFRGPMLWGRSNPAYPPDISYEKPEHVWRARQKNAFLDAMGDSAPLPPMTRYDMDPDYPETGQFKPILFHRDKRVGTYRSAAVWELIGKTFAKAERQRKNVRKQKRKAHAKRQRGGFVHGHSKLFDEILPEGEKPESDI